MSGIKNISLSNNWKRKNKRWLKFLIGALVFFIFLFILNIFDYRIKNIFFTLSSPIQKLFWSAGNSSSGFLGSILNSGNFAKENENLKSENQNLLAKISFLQSIVKGNQDQSNVSLSCQEEQFQLQMASVIGVNNQDFLTLNKGSSDGILEDMPVINNQKALVGKVFKVYKNFSEIMLISNENSVVSVKVLNSEIDGVVRGEGGRKAYLDFVPIDSNINQYDVLITSALDGIFPKNLLVAKILKVEKNDQEPHQKAQVEIFSDFLDNNLFIIKNYKQK